MPLDDTGRLADLKAKLESRTANDKAKPGYRKNVEALRAAIAKLERAGAE